MFQGQLFSISATFESGEKRVSLLLCLLFLAFLVSLPEGRHETSRFSPGDPFIMRLTNHFDVPGGCEGGSRECDLILLQGENLHNGTRPRVRLAGIAPLNVVKLDDKGMALLVEIPRGVADGPHTLELANPLGEDEMIWTLKPR